jgi:hypothetical protein
MISTKNAALLINKNIYNINTKRREYHICIVYVILGDLDIMGKGE